MDGPTDAVPVPSGGRLPVLVDGCGGCGGFDWTCAGVGGVLGIFPAGTVGLGDEVGVGFVVAVARMGACGTPAVEVLCEPGKTVLSTLSSA